jgi:hypothetical protein
MNCQNAIVKDTHLSMKQTVGYNLFGHKIKVLTELQTTPEMNDIKYTVSTGSDIVTKEI